MCPPVSSASALPSIPSPRSITVHPERKRIPISMPDDFGIREAADRRVASWLAVTLFALFVVALVLLGVKP